MHRTYKLLGAAVLLIGTQTALAAGDPDKGKQKAQVCASCHGANGVSTAPNFPIIAGQYADYIVHALKGYKSGERKNPVMMPFAQNLSEDDMEDLAAYFAAQNGLAAPKIEEARK